MLKIDTDGSTCSGTDLEQPRLLAFGWPRVEYLTTEKSWGAIPNEELFG